MKLVVPSCKDEFLIQAIKHYDSGIISMKEFKRDLRIIKKIHKELRRYLHDGTLDVRLTLNNFIIAYNQFGPFATALIFYDCDDIVKNLSIHFIVKLGRRDNLVDTFELSIDERLLSELNKI